MYRKQVRRRRAVLLGLVLVGLILLGFGLERGPAGIGGAPGTVLDAVGNGASRALTPVRDLANWFDETMAAKGERDRMSAALEKARKEMVAGRVAVQENRQLRELVELGEKGVTAGYRPVTARITGRSPTLWYTTVSIAKGKRDGIRVNDPVISGAGLAGRVSSVSRGGAVVTLISDSASAVSARILPGGAQGVIRPKAGDPGHLVIEFLDQTRNVGKGQTVVTSGWRDENLASLYPPDLPIGEVDKAPIGQREATQRVEVRAFADFANLDLVQVLTGGRPE